MIDALYNIGKATVEDYGKNSYDKLNREDKVNIQSFNKNNRDNTHVIYIIFKKESNNKLKYKEVRLTEFILKNINKLLYKEYKNSLNGSPTFRITSENDKNKLNNNFSSKFIKFFQDYKKHSKISLLHDEIEKNKHLIESDLESKLIELGIFNEKGKINKNEKTNRPFQVLVSMIIEENSTDNYLIDYECFVNIFFEKIKNSYYKTHGKEILSPHGTCLLCNEEKKIYGNVLPALNLKYGAVDKIGNMPNFSLKENWKQIPICEDCASYITIGNNFINEYLEFREFGLNYYVIPKFLINPIESFKKVYKYFKKNDKNSYGLLVLTLEKYLMKKAISLNDYLEFEFVYFFRNQDSLKIIGFVDSLLPSWLNKIYQEQLNIGKYTIFSEDNMKKTFGDSFKGNLIENLINHNEYYTSSNWYIGFLREYMPKLNEKTENKEFIEIITSILNGRKIDYNFLLSVFMKKITTQMYKKSTKNNNTNTNQYNQLLNLKYTTFKSLILIILLDNLDLFKGGRVMNNNYDNILEMLKNEDQKVAFLMGELSRIVINRQYKDHKSSSFLNKLRGFSLNHKQLQNLYPTLISKLKDYNIWYTQDIERCIAELLIKTDSNWNLTRDETSYYFTLGFTMYKYEKKEEDEKDE